ncbi:MAG: hypothetical protein ACR2K3_01930 [Nocardioides sp.]
MLEHRSFSEVHMRAQPAHELHPAILPAVGLVLVVALVVLLLLLF